MPINPADYGLEWQNAQLALLPEQARLQFSGGGQPAGYSANDFDAHMQGYSSYLGPSLYSDSPSASFTAQNMNALGMIFPGIKNQNAQDMSMMDINRVASDVKSPFTPYYFGVTSDGYSAPVGKPGPGGVIFNSGLGKSNENPGDYKTPGAGLWAAGFDLNDPLLTQKLYDYFGRNRGPVFEKYKPQKLEDGSYRKATPQEALAFVSDADEWFRKEALKMDLPKRGIMDSLAGQLITGALIGAATGGFGTIVGGLTGSSALGNLASLAVNTAIGGAQGGWGGALTSALGSSIGAGMDQAGGWSNIGDFLSDPFGYIGSAYGIGGGAFSGLNLAGMGEAAQVGPGSTAQVTPPSSIGQNVLSTDYVGGIPHEVVEVVADAGDVAQIGGGFGSAVGGGAGSVLGNLLTGGAGAGALDVGGLLDAGPSIPGTPGNPTGSIQTTAPGTTPTAGTGTGQTGTIGGPGGIGPDGMPIGTPGPYSDAYGQTPMGTGTGTGTMYGVPGADAPGMSYEDQQLFGTIPGIMIPMGGSWNYTGAPTGTTTGIPDGFGPGPGTTGLLDTGPGPGGPGPGGSGPGGDGLGGDGTGGDGLGGGNNFGGFNYSGLLGGMTPGGMGDPVSFLTPRAYGTKKKGPASFYGKLQAPKKRKGITVRRA